ncbi:MAG: S1C family serine protease [bacterium]
MQTSKQFNIVLLIIFALLAGWLGSLIFSWSSGQTMANSLLDRNGQVIIQDAKKVIVEQDNQAAATVSGLQQVMVGLYLVNEQSWYELTKPQAQALIITSDGWLLTNAIVTNKWVAVTKDKDIYNIDKVVADANSDFIFVHVAGVNNLPVSRFGQVKDLQLGQAVIGVNWFGPVWLSTLSAIENNLFNSSENVWQELTLLPAPVIKGQLVVTDLSGWVIGLLNSQGQLRNTDYIIAMINNLLADRPLNSPYLGVNYQDLSWLTGQPVKNGARLTSLTGPAPVVPKSPAAQAGLQANDIIISINGVNLDKDHDLAEELLAYRPGETIIISYLRGEEEKTAEVVLGVK